ncbi:MAG TPA: hypothetical protein PLT01_05350 [Bacteroidaceae bacterium]|nr:hypothetical protein [Bacteroidaceae bacterium]
MKKKTRLAIWGTSIFLLVISVFFIVIGLIFGLNETFVAVMMAVAFFSLTGFLAFAEPIYDDEDEDEDEDEEDE